MKSTTSWLLKTSQTPSHARTMNSSVGCRWKILTSGVLQMIWCSGANDAFCLYLRSPIERERLRSPFTRGSTWGPMHWFRTQPPAFSMRAHSLGRLGLWSSDMSMARPSRQSTARLSPALATTMESGRTQQTTAVQPIKRGSTLRKRGTCLESAFSKWMLLGSASSSSMRWNAARSALAMSQEGRLAISPGRCSSQKRATCSPPCPSMTAKIAVSLHPLRWPSGLGGNMRGFAMCASSIASRHPCMQLYPHKSRD
mmetsp:Transcript_88940/g.247082  ORF Transcript_88940/g.247082 Transcript_88940/m.247082 type:complete len:255 (+) Transcript_88940:380-1144(+)